MTTYIIHGQQFSGDVTLSYGYDGRLYKVQFDCVMQEQQYRAFVKALPATITDMQQWIQRAAGIKYSLLPPCLDFDIFWDTYAYKIGNKDKARKLWNTLTEAQRTKALASLPRYSYYLQMHPSIERVYPERYLSQRRYENQY